MLRAVRFCVGAACVALIGAVEFGGPSAWASDQFAVIRPQLQFDADDSWATYPGRNSTARLLAGTRSRSRWSQGPTSEGRSGARSAKRSVRGRSFRGSSPFEATGATPLLRDLPTVERHPPPTRRRALGW